MVPDGRKGKDTVSILIDLAKAYDSVNREKLMKVLAERCRDEDETKVVALIGLLHMNQRS